MIYKGHLQYSGISNNVQSASTIFRKTKRCPSKVRRKQLWGREVEHCWPPACQPSSFSQHPSQIQNHWIEEHKFNSIGNWVELGSKHKKSKWMMNLRRVFKCTIWPPAAKKWLCPHLESRCCILPGLSISIWDYRHFFSAGEIDR